MPHEHPIVLPRPRRKPATQRMLICCNCGAEFLPSRIDAKWCSGVANPTHGLGSGTQRQQSHPTTSNAPRRDATLDRSLTHRTYTMVMVLNMDHNLVKAA